MGVNVVRRRCAWICPTELKVKYARRTRKATFFGDVICCLRSICIQVLEAVEPCDLGRIVLTQMRDVFPKTGSWRVPILEWRDMARVDTISPCPNVKAQNSPIRDRSRNGVQLPAY